MDPSKDHSGFARLITDTLTGVTGESWAFGKVAAIPVLIVGVALPVAFLWLKVTFTLAECGVYWGGLAAGIGTLVALSNTTEPKAPPEKGDR